MSGTSSNLPKVDAAEILAGIERRVEIETPSFQGGAVDKLADVIEENMRALGAAIERSPGRDGIGDTLIACGHWRGDEPRAQLMIRLLETLE